MNIPKNVMSVIQTLENAGFEAYIVGGCVRDMLLNIAPEDFDITTSATPDEIKKLFPHTVDIGIKHGTVAVIVMGEKIEVTTYRVDGEYIDGRRPESVMFTSNINEDLSRRDFTINAIAYNPRVGFCDPFCGHEGIKKKLIKCVGDADTRFNEDALRMVRAVRFAATLGFDIDGKTCMSILANKKNLNLVSPERIYAELKKMITGAYPDALNIIKNTGLMPYILRGGNINYARLPELIQYMKICPADYHMRLALLFDSICKNYGDVLEALKVDNQTKHFVYVYMSFLHKPLAPDSYEIKKTLRHMPPPLFDNLLKLQEIVLQNVYVNEIKLMKNEILQNGECYELKQLAVNGGDLAALGIKEGRQMGALLEGLLDKVMQNPELNNKITLLDYVNQDTL